MTEGNVAPADEIRAEARARAVALVHGGFTDFDDAVEIVADYFADEEEPLREDEARDIVEAVWSARLAEQRGWPAVTDADRLLGVFDALGEADIVAEPHFACCAGCGRAEIGGFATPDSRGFVFFHEQDTDRAVAGEGLMLAYGGFDGTTEQTAAIGREVAAALTAAGLRIDWTGTPDKRIHVTPLEWRIRIGEAEAAD
jgi:hypothetical protein